MAMKDLEQRLDALEDRLAHVEAQAGIRAPEQVEADQEAADRELLSRNATTYEEAVAQQAARARQDERDANGATFEEDAEQVDENPPVV